MKLQDYLKENPLLFDGAMGTYLTKQHPQEIKQGCEMLNLTHPEWIRKVHREYLEAGASAIKTNTFGVCEYMLSQPKETVHQIICQGWKIAFEEALAYEETIEECDGMGEILQEHYVFADIGPVACHGEDGFTIYREIVNWFLECGATHFIFETLGSMDYIAEITSYIKEKEPNAFVLVSFGVSPEGFTQGGYYGRSLFYQLQKIETVDAIGFNCVSGPKHLLDMIKKLDVVHCNKYISVMPNAGYPTMVLNRTFYGNNPVYYSNETFELFSEGVSIVGGCCGTEPSYIRQLAQKIRNERISLRPLWETAECSVECMEKAICGSRMAMENPKNDFAAKLNQGEKVLVVELDPPVTPEINVFMEGAARYKRAGADAIDIADCPIAKARIDSSILASKVSRELKMTAIPHMTCRDRNINATKALLLGLNVEGVNNVLTVTGDPVPVAQRQEVKTVFSYNSAVLARHINTFNETTFTENPFMVCGALNINALNFESQLTHAKKKIENGVNVLFTQPVMTKQGLENLKRARQELPVKILGGLIPVVSYRNACFMEHEIAGINVDSRIIEMYQGKTREEGEELAVRIVTAIAKEIVEYVDGFYLITPFQRIGLIEKIIFNLKEIQ